MIAHEVYQLAIRARAITLAVCTTGSSSLSATATGFARSAGSFKTDGFAAGMELVATGFSASNNTAKVIAEVTDLAITVDGSCEVQSEAPARTLSVALPSKRAWENSDFTPVAGIPFVEEDYLPGPSPSLETTGPRGEIELFPSYVLRVSVPENTGILASARYAQELLDLFPPGLAIALSNGDTLRVRTDQGPYPGQRQPSRPGFSVMPVTIPFWLRTFNSI